MRKREILKHYKSSLKKWEKILKHIKEEKDLDYTQSWVSCGFCDVHAPRSKDVCSGCPLFSKDTNLTLYCFEDGVLRPVSRKVLEFANNEDWPEAGKLCKQFIAKIKREIKKVGG